MALLSQYGFGLHPCELCLAQRVPYGLILPLAAMAWWKPQLRFLGWLLALLFVVDGGIAAYHVAVEQQWIPGPTACSGTPGKAVSLDALREQIMGAAVVACTDVAFRFLGLSMAGWNVLYALGSAALTGKLLKDERKYVASGR